MKIMFFTDHFAPEISAPAAHIVERSRIWVQQGHEVTIVTNVPNYPLGEPYEGYKNKWRQWDDMDGIKVLRVGTYMAENKGTLKRTLDYISFALSSFINSLFLPRPDVVYSTTPHIFAPLGGVFFSFIRRVPHVLEVRDLWPASIAATTGMKKTSLIYRAFETLEKFLYRASRRIVVFTQAFKTDLVSRGVPEDKIDVVINGANLDLFAKPVHDEALEKELGLKDKFTIAYFGTLGLAHGLTNAVRAAKLVEDDDIHFLFVGEGADKSEMQHIATELNTTNVHFIGRQDRATMPRFWGLCQVGLVHLKNDPVFETVIPSKIFETMAVGLPIAYCGPKSEGADTIAQNKAGLIAENYTPEALANILRALKNDQALYDELRHNSAQSAQKYSRVAQAANTLNALGKACK